MGILLPGSFKLTSNDAFPLQVDGKKWFAVAGTSRAKATALSVAGVSTVCPPALKTQSGTTLGADGYGPFGDYDIDPKNQKESGTRQRLEIVSGDCKLRTKFGGTSIQGQTGL